MNNKMSHILEMIVVFVLTVAATIGLYSTVINNDFLLPQAASAQAGPIDELFNIQWILISFFTSLIVVFMLYSLIRSVIQHGWNPDNDVAGEYFEGNTQLEIIWTAVPLAIVLFLAYIGANTLAEVERRDVNALEVNVIASQWNWRFEYPETGASSPVLYLPEDRQVVLNMRSNDVIHSFWIPEFRVKQDILPDTSFDGDYARVVRITPSEQGEFQVRCAELCGSQHYAMLASVIVMDEADFEAKLVELAAECDLGDVECGARWVEEFGCTACHSVDGSVIVGPTWLNLASEEVVLDDGTSFPADAEYVYSSIVDPNSQIVEGFNADVMPQNFSEQLTEDQINQIVAFILSVNE